MSGSAPRYRRRPAPSRRIRGRQMQFALSARSAAATFVVRPLASACAQRAEVRFVCRNRKLTPSPHSSRPMSPKRRLSVRNAGRWTSRRSRRRAPAASLPEVSPGPPCSDGNHAPGDEGCDEGYRCLSFHKQRKDQSETEQANASQSRSRCIKRGGLLAAPVPAKAGSMLTLLLVFFDQGGACAKDRRQRQKQPPDRRTERTAD